MLILQLPIIALYIITLHCSKPPNHDIQLNDRIRHRFHLGVRRCRRATALCFDAESWFHVEPCTKSEIRSETVGGIKHTGVRRNRKPLLSLDGDCCGSVIRFDEIKCRADVANHCTGHDGAIRAIGVLAMLDCHVQRYTVGVVGNGNRPHYRNRVGGRKQQPRDIDDAPLGRYGYRRRLGVVDGIDALLYLGNLLRQVHEPADSDAQQQGDEYVRKAFHFVTVFKLTYM